MQVNPLASGTLLKSDWIVESVIAPPLMKEALGGVGSSAAQFGPRELMKEVLPKSAFP